MLVVSIVKSGSQKDGTRSFKEFRVCEFVPTMYKERLQQLQQSANDEARFHDTTKQLRHCKAVHGKKHSKKCPFDRVERVASHGIWIGAFVVRLVNAIQKLVTVKKAMPKVKVGVENDEIRHNFRDYSSTDCPWIGVIQGNQISASGLDRVSKCTLYKSTRNQSNCCVKDLVTNLGKTWAGWLDAPLGKVVSAEHLGY